jgi:hypothetical protein
MLGFIDHAAFNLAWGMNIPHEFDTGAILLPVDTILGDAAGRVSSF